MTALPTADARHAVRKDMSLVTAWTAMVLEEFGMNYLIERKRRPLLLSSMCRGRSERCSSCNGSGRVTCSGCRGLGGFRHLPTLRVKWFPRVSTWIYQNSFLNEKRISKGTLTLIWSLTEERWAKQSSIEYFVQSIPEEVPDIPLKANIVRDYHEKHLAPTITLNNQMRRLEYSIQRMDFEEVQYRMEEEYVNKKDPTKGRDI